MMFIHVVVIVNLTAACVSVSVAGGITCQIS